MKPAHYSSAFDLAVISRELLKYPEVLKFTSIWLDNLRQGKFILRNTNELIKVYPGADGLKTGHTDEAKFCLSATAKRNDFRLLSVILGADSDAKRIYENRRLLDYGYRNFQWKLIKKANSPAGRIYIKDGSPDLVPVKVSQNFGVVIPSGKNQTIRTELVPGKIISLPVKPGQSIGTLKGIFKGETVGETSVYSTVKVKRANFLVRAWRSLRDFIKGLFGKRR
jgi:D-alanyl-D-alanine carboxypeptidase (penicillin-binding protein 5/6)